MATVYPAQTDTSITLPTVVDTITPVSASVVNILRDAILAIEAELGVKPSGIYGTVRTRLDTLEALINSGGGGGGGSVTFGGDLIGNSVHQVVVGLQSVPVSSTSPIQSAVPVYDVSNTRYDIRKLTQDDISPGFAISSFSGGSVVEVGATITNPSFTASYASTPVSAYISNTDSIDSPLNLISPFTSATVVGSFTHTTPNASVVFTLNASAAVSKSATQTISYLSRTFSGVGTASATSATTSGNNALLVGATGTLSGSSTFGGLFSSVVGQSFGPFTPTNQKIYILTIGSHTFLDQNGFAFVFNAPTSFSFTNQNGSVFSMVLYESTNLLSTSFTITVAS